jgi:hypothetical protein
MKRKGNAVYSKVIHLLLAHQFLSQAVWQDRCIINYGDSGVDFFFLRRDICSRGKH